METYDLMNVPLGLPREDNNGYLTEAFRYDSVKISVMSIAVFPACL